jgi:hypothetical protein
MKSYGATPEHKFHPVRKWRFDFAFPPQMVAFEFEGGVLRKAGTRAVSVFPRTAINTTSAGWAGKFTGLQRGTLQTAE